MIPFNQVMRKLATWKRCELVTVRLHIEYNEQWFVLKSICKNGNRELELGLKVRMNSRR